MPGSTRSSRASFSCWLPGIDAEKAQRILELRMNGSGFESASDLDLVLDLDPGTLAELSARAVFLPHY